MVRTAVLVSGGGTNLQTLIDGKIFGELSGCDLTCVISSEPGAYALTRASAAGIPGFVVEYDLFPNSASFCQALEDKLGDLDIELVVLAGFLRRLEPSLLKKYQHRIIDVYPSLLPAFGGTEGVMSPHELALDYGVKVSGATAYFRTGGPGEGPVILQAPVEIWEGDTPRTLQRRVMEEAEWKILPRAVSLFCQSRLSVDGRTVHIAGEEK